MKKIIILLCAVLGLLTFSSCGKKKEKDRYCYIIKTQNAMNIDNYKVGIYDTITEEGYYTYKGKDAKDLDYISLMKKIETNKDKSKCYDEVKSIIVGYDDKSKGNIGELDIYALGNIYQEFVGDKLMTYEYDLDIGYVQQNKVNAGEIIAVDVDANQIINVFKKYEKK